MGEVSGAVVLVKSKRPRVSAVRDFPRGCGSHAVRVCLKPTEETPPLAYAELEYVKVSKFEGLSGADATEDLPKVEELVGSSLKVPKPEPEELVVPVKDLGILGHEARKEVEEGEGIKCLSEPIIQLETLDLLKVNLVRPDSLDGPKTDEGVEKQSYSKIYGPPKRRSISATRDFSVGCGRIAPKIIREECSEVAAASSTENKALDGEKKSDLSLQPVVEESVGVAATEKAEDEVRRNDCKQIREGVEEISCEAQFKSASESGLNENIVEERSEMNIFVGSKKFEGCDMKQPMLEGSIKVASAEKVEGEVKRDGGKQIRQKVHEISSEAQVKSASKSGLNENTVEECHEKKILVRSTSEKKSEGRDMKHASNNLQNKEPRLDAKPPSGSKVVDKEGRSLIGTPGDKGSVKHQKDPKNLKRKLSEEIEDEGCIVEYQTQGNVSLKPYGDRLIVQALMSAENCPWRKKLSEKFEDEGRAQGNGSLEAYGDRLIVQALMSAENCPWRKDMKFGGSSSHSVTLKNKAKKEEKLLIKKFASKGSSASQHKSELYVEDEEDFMPHNDGNEKSLVIYKRSVPQDDGNEKACTLYKRSLELSVTVTPSVPPKLDLKGADSEEIVTRNKVKKALRLFQVICRKLLQGEEAKSKLLGKKRRVDLQASSILKENNEWVNYGKQPIFGNVPGVEVGDEFQFRVELSIIGLHRPFQGGIDYMKKDGKIFAVSIVASGGYPDDMDSSDVLIYSGSGGNPVGGDKQPGDQVLERGNLALKNSIDAKTPVRVIHDFKELKGSDSHDARAKIVSRFTYDGLYIVERYRQEKGPHGFYVFKFQLRRMPGQPELALQEAKKSKKSNIREGLCSKDISQREEIMPICAVNTVDNDHPIPFKYITKTMYPSWYVQTPPRGCGCSDGCSDSEKCACAVKNGGEIPFNFNGSIVQAKPLVYECGPSCKCPPLCHNRVSQHGIKIPLEIFKTKSRGWGLRSLYSIQSGSFICEYIGEMLQDTEAEQRSNDEYLFDIGHNYDDHSLWEGLPTLIPGLQSSSACETVEDVGFTIDAAEYGNVGRFINHSCSPNLYAQNVLYDLDDKRMPHIMFFAADNIPPLQEITYHYNYMIDQVRDSEGNIKQKDCYCGSPECTGRLY